MRYNQVKLYHYSDKDIQGKIKPAFFGDNTYTGNDKKASQVKRAFCYLGRHKIEYSLNYSKYLYITEINSDKLYYLDIDKARLKDRFKIKGVDFIDITKLLKHIKKRYTGAVYTGNIAIIFKDLKYNKKIIRGCL